MAKRQSTSNVYRGRSGSLGARARQETHQSPEASGSGIDECTPPAGLSNLLRTERDRLAEAQSVLTCVHLALMYADRDEASDPNCAKAVAIALSLVRETAHQLDVAWVTRKAEDLSALPLRRRPVPARR